jgi:hypothetical protein
MAKSILAEFTPKVFVCMWSYAHRREADWPGATSMQRRTHFNVNTDMVDDYNLFQDAVRELRDHRAVHLVIPNWHPLQDAPKIWQDIRGESWPEDLPLDLSSIPASCVQEIDEVHGIGDDFFTRINLYWQFQALKHDFQFIDYDQVDWARDRHHLGADSCKLLADKIAAVIGVP